MAVFPAVSKSHFAVGEALTVGLAKAGHQLTLVSPYEYKTNLPNLEAVQLTGAIEKMEGTLNKLFRKRVEGQVRALYTHFKIMCDDDVWFLVCV